MMKSLDDKALFESNNLRFVNAVVEDKYRFERLVFTIIIKNNNKTSNTNVKYQNNICHMDPLFRFRCRCCQSNPMTEVQRY